jgi:hypothetical protein
LCEQGISFRLFDRRREFGAKSILARRVAVERRLLLAEIGLRLLACCTALAVARQVRIALEVLSRIRSPFCIIQEL